MEEVDGQWFSSFFCRLDENENTLCLWDIAVFNINRQRIVHVSKYSIHWYYYSQCTYLLKRFLGFAYLFKWLSSNVSGEYLRKGTYIEQPYNMFQRELNNCVHTTYAIHT